MTAMTTKPKPKALDFGPQEGPQTAFLATRADIAIYGGAAGGGKSYALLLEPLRHYHNKKFGGVIFRRTTVQIRNEGGLWDESMELYSHFKGRAREQNLEWIFPSGMRMKFAHLEHDKTVYDWQGAQVPFMGFDELTHFTEAQFWYMLSRNRSTSGVPAYIRATTNPDVDSWVRRLIDWWVDKDGFPIKERSGILRWFIRQDDNLIWGDTREELLEKYGKECEPKSLTFIASSLQDNQILMAKDPGYKANLMALARVQRLRLLSGNWNVKPSAGLIFRREWFPMVDSIPAGWNRIIRAWDRAATLPSEVNPNPDWTRGLKLYKYPDGSWLIADMRSDRNTPQKIETLVKTTAQHDTNYCEIVIEQEPGASGVADKDNYVRLLSGYRVRVQKATTDKLTRALPVSSQCEHGNMKVLRGTWNEDFFKEIENFPSEKEGEIHDDQVDTLSMAFNEMSGTPSILSVL